MTYSEGLTVQVQNYTKGDAQLYADLDITGSSEDSYIDVPLFYYPDYHAKDQDGRELALTASPDGLIRLTPSDSLQSIHVYYKEPVLWKICAAVSFATLVLLCIGLCREKIFPATLTPPDRNPL